MIMIDGIEYQQTAEGYPYKLVKSHDTYNVFASLTDNMAYVLANSTKVHLQAQKLKASPNNIDIASRMLDSDTAMRVFSAEIDTEMTLAMLEENEEKRIALLHQYAANILYKLFDSKLHFRPEIQIALSSLKNEMGERLFNADDFKPDSLPTRWMINAVYSSIGFGFAHVVNLALEEADYSSEQHYIYQKVLEELHADQSILDKVKMTGSVGIESLTYSHTNEMTLEMSAKFNECAQQAEQAADYDSIQANFDELYKLNISDEIKQGLKTVEKELTLLVNVSGSQRIIKLLPENVTARLSDEHFEGFANEIKKQIKEREEKDIRFLQQVDKTISSIGFNAKMLSDEYSHYDLPSEHASTQKIRSAKHFATQCFNKTIEIQQEVIRQLDEPTTTEKAKSTLNNRVQDVQRYLVMAQAAAELAADRHVHHTVTGMVALQSGQNKQDKSVTDEVFPVDPKPEDCSLVLSARAKQLSSEMMGLLGMAYEQHTQMKTALIDKQAELSSNTQLSDLVSEINQSIKMLQDFSVMSQEGGVIQEGYKGLEQVQELQALRDTSYSLYKKLGYNFAKIQKTLHEVAAVEAPVHDKKTSFQVLNSDVQDFFTSARKDISQINHSSLADEKQEKLIAAIKATANDRLKVKRMFRTGEVLKLYQRAAGMSSPVLDQNNLNEFIQEITSFQKWTKWGLGGVSTIVNTGVGEEKYRLPHGIALMWETIKGFGVIYNQSNKYFELPKERGESESEGEGQKENEPVFHQH